MIKYPKQKHWHIKFVRFGLAFPQSLQIGLLCRLCFRRTRFYGDECACVGSGVAASALSVGGGGKWFYENHDLYLSSGVHNIVSIDIVIFWCSVLRSLCNLSGYQPPIRCEGYQPPIRCEEPMMAYCQPCTRRRKLQLCGRWKITSLKKVHLNMPYVKLRVYYWIYTCIQSLGVGCSCR